MHFDKINLKITAKKIMFVDAEEKFRRIGWERVKFYQYQI
jgi:hypothetical protein